jgi:hypothetical protein
MMHGSVTGLGYGASFFKVRAILLIVVDKWNNTICCVSGDHGVKLHPMESCSTSTNLGRVDSTSRSGSDFDSPLITPVICLQLSFLCDQEKEPGDTGSRRKKLAIGQLGSGALENSMSRSAARIPSVMSSMQRGSTTEASAYLTWSGGRFSLTHCLARWVFA